MQSFGALYFHACFLDIHVAQLEQLSLFGWNCWTVHSAKWLSRWGMKKSMFFAFVLVQINLSKWEMHCYPLDKSFIGCFGSLSKWLLSSTDLSLYCWDLNWQRQRQLVDSGSFEVIEITMKPGNPRNEKHHFAQDNRNVASIFVLFFSRFQLKDVNQRFQKFTTNKPLDWFHLSMVVMGMDSANGFLIYIDGVLDPGSPMKNSFFSPMAENAMYLAVSDGSASTLSSVFFDDLLIFTKQLGGSDLNLIISETWTITGGIFWLNFMWRVKSNSENDPSDHNFRQYFS